VARGRLLSWFRVDLKLLDPEATIAPVTVGSTTVLDSGYDPVFRVTRRVPDGTWEGTSVKQYTTVTLKAQVSNEQYDDLAALINGNELQHLVNLVFHFKDLVRVGMVDAVTGVARIRVDAQLTAYRNRRGILIQDIAAMNMFAVEARPVAFGIGESRNLLQVRFDTREHGPRSG